LFEFQVEQIERLLDEAAFDEFFSDDIAEGFEIEGFALGKVFNAAGELRGAAGDILAAPGDFFIRFEVARRTRRGRRG
jgi:hypothetical protein